MTKILKVIATVIGYLLASINMLIGCFGSIIHAMMAWVEPVALIPWIGWWITGICCLMASGNMDPDKPIRAGAVLVTPPLVIYIVLSLITS